MKKTIFIWIGVIFIAMTGGGGCNLFNEMSNKTGDTVIADDVANLIDRGLYSDAIAKWYTLSGYGQGLRPNKLLLASAYAGRGGLDVINVAQAFTKGAGATLFLTLMQAFGGATINSFNDEVSAEGVLQSISTTGAARTIDENVFMIFIEFAKIGTLLAAKADPTATGSVSASFQSCNDISVSQADQIATAVGNLIDSFAFVTLAFGAAPVGQISGFCAAAGISCAFTTMASLQALPAPNLAALEKFVQTLVGETNAGIGLQVASEKEFCEITPLAGPPLVGNCLASASSICP